METTLMHSLHYFSIAILCCCGNIVHAIELPKYTVLLSESDFQIRLYNESTWISALVSGATSYKQSYKIGFQRLYQYIHGANLNSSKIAYTAPVITSMPSSPSENDGYIVRMFISTHFEGKPPQPNPKLKLRIEKWKTECIAVRKFGAYAKDDHIDKEIEALVTTLNKHSAMIDRSFYNIAKYNASYRNVTDRLNEVWIRVLEFGTQCWP
ncbi:hypothetical protein VNO78_27112 [Psophocarpus tetragonolobus]|uniref:SOUL heme-binding protein n=1 Tax=Psophocarpus tetragonolobus TaxID=3891 RepID=A0AAN9XAS3_PSOTE